MKWSAADPDASFSRPGALRVEQKCMAHLFVLKHEAGVIDTVSASTQKLQIASSIKKVALLQTYL